MPRLKLLQEYKLLGKLHRGILGTLEAKCFVDIRLQLYNNKKSKVLYAERRESFKNNILACDQDSIVDDLMGIKADIIIKNFTFFIDYLVDEQVSLQCSQLPILEPNQKDFKVIVTLKKSN